MFSKVLNNASGRFTGSEGPGKAPGGRSLGKGDGVLGRFRFGLGGSGNSITAEALSSASKYHSLQNLTVRSSRKSNSVSGLLRSVITHASDGIAHVQSVRLYTTCIGSIN